MGEKAPCPDGYGSNFFKDSWDIIIKDLEEGVLEFFKSRKMLKVINNTIITVIPKSSHAEAVGDYRPIVCCNTVYKVISKMLCNRLKVILPSIISENQSAFVAGRTIMQNILICQNLVRLYNRKAATRSCLIKIDLKKAYDSIEWDFVEEMLHALNFPMKFIRWIMEFISTTQYTMAINGGLYGSIKGKRGLRLGDPISPLLFVVCMEYFTRIMKLVAQHESFGYHTKCRSLQFNHLCFADDVLLFYKGEFNSVMLILRGFQTFSNSSGLTTNAYKSNIFAVNMEIENLCEKTGYNKGRLPFKYLGVPISSKKLSKKDCQLLVDKITTRIRSWGSKHLSYAGRVQMINAVLMHIYTYRASIFILPKAVLKRIKIICRNYLWDGKVETNRIPLVA